MALSQSEKVRKFQSLMKKIRVKKLGRKIRGFVKTCENCGKKRQELFKIYTFKNDVERAHFYCRQCYSKLIQGKRI
jgi:hypothetical protein